MSPLAILLQTSTTVNVELADKSMSLFDLLLKGGVVMIPIFLLSIVGFYLFIEKIIFIRKAARIDPRYMADLLSQAEKNDWGQALKISQYNRTAIGRIFESGISQSGKPAKEVEGFMESAANIEIAKMERNISYLGIIAGIAPMLGFIGTIAGVIHIFYNISITDNISIGIIAGGLYQKMVSSGTGLMVGIISYSFYHYLQIMIDKFSLHMQSCVFDFMKKYNVKN
jgi:biopolymer transport protein ExbB